MSAENTPGGWVSIRFKSIFIQNSHSLCTLDVLLVDVIIPPVHIHTDCEKILFQHDSTVRNGTTFVFGYWKVLIFTLNIRKESLHGQYREEE